MLGFAHRLRAGGIDAEIDLWNASPPEGWPLWCERQIAAADFVLMVCTETYRRRISGDEESGKGLGVVWEARIIYQLLYDAGARNDKFVPVLFSEASPEQIPMLIRRWTWYVVDREDGYEDLYRRLTGQPRWERPEVGTIVPLPPRELKWSEGMMEAATSHPYPGLRPFSIDESEFFFGRERETDALIEQFRDPGCRFRALVGASGIGRSSLVYAGVLPRLAAGDIPGSADWRIISFKPGSHGDNPFLALASELRLGDEPIRLAGKLEQDPSSIGRLADQALTGRPPSAQLLVFVDQMEQLFTKAAEGYRESFCNLLAAAARHHRVRVLATLREDFRAEADRFESLANLLKTGHYPVAPPGTTALIDIIRRPAERVGVTLEAGLVTKILKDAGSDPGALPQIAFCLKQLYDMCATSGRMTIEAYHSTGGIHDAIGERADKLLEEIKAQLETDVISILHSIFDKLVTVENEKVIRKRASRDTLDSKPVQKLVEKLIDGKILVCAQPQSKSNEPSECATIELAHDALLEKWPKLKEWVEWNRSDIQKTEELKHAAHRWLSATHDRNAFLWRGGRLKEAIRLLKQHQSRFDGTEINHVRDFIRASIIQKWRDTVFMIVLGVCISPLIIAPTLVYITPSVVPRRKMPVGSSEPNGFGLYDVIGNVWEWTEDCVEYTRRGRDIKGCYARGGSWDNHQEEYVRPESSELFLEEFKKERIVGFRVARELSPYDVEQEKFSKPSEECDNCPTMVTIPKPEGKDAEPLIRALAIGQFEVTSGQWDAYVKDNHKPDGCKSAQVKHEYPGERRPIIGVNIDDARCYAKWMSSETQARYRLPSGDEWKDFADYNGRKISTGEANCVACGATWKQFFDWLASAFERTPSVADTVRPRARAPGPGRRPSHPRPRGRSTAARYYRGCRVPPSAQA